MKNLIFAALLLASFSINAAMYLPSGNDYVSDDADYSFCNGHSCEYKEFTKTENVQKMNVSGMQIFFDYGSSILTEVVIDITGPILFDGFEFDGVYSSTFIFLIEPGLHTFKFRWLPYINGGSFSFEVNAITSFVPIPPSFYSMISGLILFQLTRYSKRSNL